MGFLSYGMGKGLSVKHDFQKDIENLYRSEAYRSRVMMGKERKAQYYAGLMKERTAVAPSMIQPMEEMYKKLNNQIADFAIENPGFETDVNKMQQFYVMTDQYLNNDLVRKDIQSQEQFELLKKAVNDGELDVESAEYEAEMEKYTDWMENGGDGYIFTNPEVLNYSEMTIEANKNIQPDVTISDTGKQIVQITETPYARVVAYAQNELKVPEKRRAIEKAYKLVKPSGFYKNILDFRAREIASGEEKKEDFVTWNYLYKTGLDISKQKPEKIDTTYPYIIQDLFGLEPGSEIKGYDALRTLTEFGEKGRVDFGAQGREVFVDDPDNPGKVKTVKLMGQLVLVGTPVMKTMFGEAFVKVNVETIVDQNKEYEVEWIHTFKEKSDAEPQTFTNKEWMEFKNTLGLKSRQLEKLEEGTFRDMTLSSSNISTYGRMYEDAGFIGVKENIPGIMAGMKLQRTTESFPKYTGSVWMPAHLTPENVTSYEKVRGGQAHAADIHAAKSTKFENMMYEFSRTGNYTAAREMINDTMTTNKVVYTTAEGKKASKDNYSKKVSMGSWESVSREDPQIFVQKMTEENSATGKVSTIEYYYDSMTGKYYYKNLDEDDISSWGG